MSEGAKLRALFEREVPPIVPLALDPLSARFAEGAGFEALYLGGGSLGYLKAITEANLTATQMAQTALDIRAVTSLPVILDGACAWGEPLHVQNTIRITEAAGFAAIEIEDQLFPKRVHHHVGVEHLIPMEAMVDKIRAAVEARRDPNFVIVARTNACREATDDWDDAMRRAEAYREAGADMLLVLPKNPEQAKVIGEHVQGPLFYLMSGGLTTMGASPAQLGRLGYKLIVDPLTPFYASARALRRSYEALAQGRRGSDRPRGVPGRGPPHSRGARPRRDAGAGAEDRGASGAVMRQVTTARRRAGCSLRGDRWLPPCIFASIPVTKNVRIALDSAAVPRHRVSAATSSYSYCMTKAFSGLLLSIDRTIALVSRYSKTASTPFSRPIPELLTPPNGNM